MAEELDIRSLWNRSKEKEDPNALQINAMERKGTKTTLYWIKTILWIEFWLSCVGIPVYIFLDIEGYNTPSFKIFAVSITCVYLVYYQFLIREINRFKYDRNVVKSLKKVYGYLRFYLLHYKVVIWLSLLAGTILGMLDPKNKAVLTEMDSAGDWVVLLGVLAIMIGIMGGLITLLIHLIYGRKIARLRRMVRDLEEEE